LPFGKIGDGNSKSHLEHMKKTVQDDFSPVLTGLENELEIAKVKAGESPEVLELIESYERYIKLFGKLNRWLGWFQAVIVVFKGATLEEVKLINKNS
jgi:hypothetical protein